MMCYRDMTFCTAYKMCEHGNTCPRSLTPQVREDADRWWGKGADKAPISVFGDRPSCFEEIYSNTRRGENEE